MHTIVAASLALALALLPARAFAQDAGSSAPSARHAEGAPASEAQALRARYQRIAREPGGDAAAPALAHARRALQAAERAQREGRAEASERALQIADAALVLAERLAAQHRARLALEDARRRAREAETRAEAAREALSQALIERARVLAVDATPATPTTAPSDAAPGAPTTAPSAGEQE